MNSLRPHNSHFTFTSSGNLQGIPGSWEPSMSDCPAHRLLITSDPVFQGVVPDRFQSDSGAHWDQRHRNLGGEWARNRPPIQAPVMTLSALPNSNHWPHSNSSRCPASRSASVLLCWGMMCGNKRPEERNSAKQRCRAPSPGMSAEVCLRRAKPCALDTEHSQNARLRRKTRGQFSEI